MSTTRPISMREYSENLKKRISTFSPIVIKNGKMDSLGTLGFQIALTQLKKVLDENNKDIPFTKENAKPFIDFLAEYWEFIRGTDWSYSCNPDHPLTLLMLDIATAIDPNSKYQILMSTLKQTSSDITRTELNSLSLKDFMLSTDDQHYIEVKACFEYAEDDAVYKYTYTVDGHEQKLDPEETVRLSSHSKEALEHSKMINRIRELKNSQNDIGKNIEDLRDALRAGSVKGSGSEFDSGAAANEGVLKFSLFLDSLPAVERERLFKTTYINFARQIPFEEIWMPLKRQFQPGGQLAAVYCVQILSLNLTSFLQQRPEIYLVNSDVALRDSRTAFESAIASPHYAVTQSYGSVGRERQLNRILDHPLLSEKVSELYCAHLEHAATLKDPVLKLQAMNDYLEFLNTIRLSDKNIIAIKEELKRKINADFELLSAQLIKKEGINGHALLHEATRQDPTYFTFIIKNLKPDVLAFASAVKSKGNWTVLHAAAKHLDAATFIDYINLLPPESLDQLALELNAGGWTGLHMAAEQHPESFKALIEKISAKTLNQALGLTTNDGWTVLANVALSQKNPDSFEAFIAKLDPLAMSQAIDKKAPGTDNVIFKLKLLAKTQAKHDSPKAVYSAAMGLGLYYLNTTQATSWITRPLNKILYPETALWLIRALRHPDAKQYYHELSDKVRKNIETFAIQNNKYELLILHATMQPDPVKYYQALPKNVRDNIEKFALKHTNYSLLISIAELSHSPAVISKFNSMTVPLAPQEHLNISRLIHSQLDEKNQPSRAKAIKIIEDALTHANLAKNLVEASASVNAEDKKKLMAEADTQINTLKENLRQTMKNAPDISFSFLATVMSRLVSAFVAIVSSFSSPATPDSPKKKVKFFNKSHHFLHKHPKATTHSTHNTAKHHKRG